MGCWLVMGFGDDFGLAGVCTAVLLLSCRSLAGILFSLWSRAMLLTMTSVVMCSLAIAAEGGA